MNGTEFGFIGLGAMGAPMARRMIAAGFGFTVYDADPAATAPFAAEGVPVAASVADLAARAAAVFTCLPTPAVCRTVAGALAAAPGRRCTIHAEMSTLGVASLEAIAAAGAVQGVTVIDAPISGGPRAVPEGKLTCLVAGAPAAVARLRPALDALAGQVFVLGDRPGLAQAMKLGNNLMAACNLAVASEVLAMLGRAGIAPETAIDVLNVSTGRNRATELLFPTQILTGQFAQGARLDILAKDTLLAAEAAAHYGAAFPLGEAIRDAWAAAVAAGFGNQDITAIFRFMAARAGEKAAGHD